jgi:hypothetical protein
MGSGFRTFAASEILTSSNVQNYLMTQSVMYFASTAARDAAITSPVAGMVAFIDSNDANEGLYVYHGATGGWRKGPGWNAPWGYVGNGILSSASAYTSGTAWGAAFTISLSSLVANRRYLLQAFMNLEPGNTGQIEVEVGSGIGTGTEGRGFYYANGVSWVTSIAVAGMFNTTAGSMTRYVSMRKSSGLSGVRALVGSTYQIFDLGPSGAPA